MKKNLIALLIVTLVAVGLFATDPPAIPAASSFDVKTTISPINLMRITTKKFSGTSKTDFEDTTENPTYAGPLNVTTYGGQTFSAYISTLSNSRVGYKVTMSATPMTSTQSSVAAYIHYTVAANEVSVDTSDSSNGGSVSKVIINTLTNGMTGVASQSHAITLTVDQDTFEAAVEGTYTGTVTFTWTTT